MTHPIFAVLFCAAFVWFSGPVVIFGQADPSADNAAGEADPDNPDENQEGDQTNDEDSDPAEPSENENKVFTYWSAELPAGKYLIAHDSINGISMHEYVLDGAAKVTEVNISTSGVLQSRFYYVEALPIQLPSAAAQAAADRIRGAGEAAIARVVPGDPIWAKVAKSYPTTTHAGTIEYRIETKRELQELFESLEQSFLTGRSTVFRPGGEREAKDGERGGKKPDPESLPDSPTDQTTNPTPSLPPGL